MGDLPPEEVGGHHRLKIDLPRDKVLAEESALARSKAHLPLTLWSSSPMLSWIRGERLLGDCIVLLRYKGDKMQEGKEGNDGQA